MLLVTVNLEQFPSSKKPSKVVCLFSSSQSVKFSPTWKKSSALVSQSSRQRQCKIKSSDLKRRRKNSKSESGREEIVDQPSEVAGRQKFKRKRHKYLKQPIESPNDTFRV